MILQYFGKKGNNWTYFPHAPNRTVLRRFLDRGYGKRNPFRAYFHLFSMITCSEGSPLVPREHTANKKGRNRDGISSPGSITVYSCFSQITRSYSPSIRALYGLRLVSDTTKRSPLRPPIHKVLNSWLFWQTGDFAAPQKEGEILRSGWGEIQTCTGVMICPCNANKGLLHRCRIKIIRARIGEWGAEWSWFYDEGVI